MKAEDLRIGNLVFDSTKCTTVVESIIPEHNRVRYGIPLTAEWLERSGFESDRIQLYYPDKLLILSAIVQGKFYFYLEDTDGSTFSLNYVEYVHQLQNLYFTLTGEELTIKQ